MKRETLEHRLVSCSGIVLAVHGGVGTMSRKSITAARQARCRWGIEQALAAGYKVLGCGGSALDAVEAAVRVLEDDPVFNAGKGAVFNHEGKIELDATIMSGSNRAAGGVGALTIVKNPISAARAVMEKTEHVLLIGKAAERFAKRCGLAIVEPSYFRTDKRWKQLQEALSGEEGNSNDGRFGTVGAVALDNDGNLAAGTSTGGITNTLAGRLGDSAVIGAGTYADNETCAVSTTGHGEWFIRHVVAYDMAARMKYRGQSLARAAEEIIMGSLLRAGGEGGAIALDAGGNCSMPYNTEGMYRGCISRQGRMHVAIFAEELAGKS